MTFAEIMEEIISREYHSGNTSCYKMWVAATMAADEILEGYASLEDAQNEIAYLKSDRNPDGNVRYTVMGYEFGAQAVGMAIRTKRAYERCKDLLPTDEIRKRTMANFLVAQVPDPYDNGMWYPAAMLLGKIVEVRLTCGRGRAIGQKYLHVRYPVERVIVHPDGFREHTGKTTFVHFRVNLRTLEIKEV